MLAELLLVLGGHPSSLFTSTGVSTELAAYLHPGEVASLNTLCGLAADYTRVRHWAESTQTLARAAVLASSKRKGKEKEIENDPGQYVAVLAGAVRDVLEDYESLLVETEALVLSRDPATVQPIPNGSSSTSDSKASAGYVPLSLLLATFDAWHAPLSALAALVTYLEEDRTPGELMQHLSEASDTGHPALRSMFTRLLQRLWELWLSHLVVFLLDGVAADESSLSSPALGLDAGADPPHRLYKLNSDLLPRSVGGPTRESILYVGRVAATLKREGRALPRSLVEKARRDIMASKPEELDAAVQRARAEVGEWLWRHVLTGEQVAEAIESFANYFLTRDGEFAVNAIREISRLREERLLLSNPNSSSSVIRAHDLDLALLRASLGTAAESDRALEALSWSMPLGPLRPLSRPAEDDGTIRGLFSPALLGTPILLSAEVRWPLDLFMTPPAVAAYADMHAYLYAIRDAHLRVLECWSALSRAQRRRRQFTGVDEGGAGEEREERVRLARQAWGTVRAMLFFLDQLLGHFMTDIIGVQHRRLLEQIGQKTERPAPNPSISSTAPSTNAPHTPHGHRPSSVHTPVHTPHTPHRNVRAGTPTPSTPRAPPRTPGQSDPTYLDFLTLRSMHARHLAFLREGLFIADRESAVLIRDILETCKRFAGLVDRWGGDVLPELLADEPGQVAERAAAVSEISETLHDQIGEFFRLLLESQSPQDAGTGGSEKGGVAGSDRTTGGASVTRNSMRSMSRARVTQIMAGSGTKMGEVGDEGLMARHVEQLLLRLDFNGVLSAWQEGEGDVLPPRVL